MSDQARQESVARGDALYRKAGHPDPVAGLRALERLFDDPGLASLRVREPSHPAVLQHAVTSLFVDRGSDSARHADGYGVDLFDAVRRSLDLIVDQSIWSQDEDFWEVLQDPATKRFLASRLPKPKMYRDVLVELTYWASLRRGGYKPKLEELSGLPDLSLDEGGGTTWIEAKHIQLGTNPKRIKKVIEKANRQIKSADPTVAGLVYIHLSRYGQRAEVADGTPKDVQPFVDAAERAISGTSFRRIGKVVLSWDKTWLPRESVADEQPRYVMAAVRNSVVLEHASPLLESVLSDEEARVANTAVMAFDSKIPRDQLTPYVARDVVVSDLLRTTIERSQGLTPLHLVDVVRDPTGLHRHRLGDAGDEFVLATQLVSTERSGSEVVLVEGIKSADGRTTLLAAFRMFGSPSELSRWSTDPTSCFESLLDEFGLPVGAADTKASKFVESIRVPLRDGGDAEIGLIRKITQEDNVVLLGLFRRTGRFLEASWLHAVDLRLYERSLSKYL